MHTYIFSKEEAMRKIADNSFPKRAAVISFYDSDEEDKVDYSQVTDRVFYVDVPDFSFFDLDEYSIEYNSFFTEAEKLAKFILEAEKNVYSIVCQCEHGESRSPAAAAAINEFFNHDGIEVFADYNYCPNQIIYNKLYFALCCQFMKNRSSSGISRQS